MIFVCGFLRNRIGTARRCAVNGHDCCDSTRRVNLGPKTWPDPFRFIIYYAPWQTWCTQFIQKKLLISVFLIRFLLKPTIISSAQPAIPISFLMTRKTITHHFLNWQHFSPLRKWLNYPNNITCTGVVPIVANFFFAKNLPLSGKLLMIWKHVVFSFMTVWGTVGLELPGQSGNSPDNFFVPKCPGNSNPTLYYFRRVLNKFFTFFGACNILHVKFYHKLSTFDGRHWVESRFPRDQISQRNMVDTSYLVAI